MRTIGILFVVTIALAAFISVQSINVVALKAPFDKTEAFSWPADSSSSSANVAYSSLKQWLRAAPARSASSSSQDLFASMASSYVRVVIPGMDAAQLPLTTGGSGSSKIPLTDTLLSENTAVSDIVSDALSASSFRSSSAQPANVLRSSGEFDTAMTWDQISTTLGFDAQQVIGSSGLNSKLFPLATELAWIATNGIDNALDTATHAQGKATTTNIVIGKLLETAITIENEEELAITTTAAARLVDAALSRSILPAIQQKMNAASIRSHIDVILPLSSREEGVRAAQRIWENNNSASAVSLDDKNGEQSRIEINERAGAPTLSEFDVELFQVLLWFGIGFVVILYVTFYAFAAMKYDDDPTLFRYSLETRTRLKDSDIGVGRDFY